MAARKHNPLRSGGHVWGPRRVALGISIRDLEELSGVARPTISQAERGRLIATPAEHDKIEKVLIGLEAAKAVGEPVARLS